MNNTLILLHPHTNIFGIEVPEDATIYGYSLYYVINGKLYYKYKYELLGTVKNKVIDFGCEPLVKANSYYEFGNRYHDYYDYITKSYCYYGEPQASFLSLMESNNLDLTKD